MKKKLLSGLLFLTALALTAQSKTTGSVALMSGMTATLALDSSTTTATLTLTGPSDRWFALQFGSFATGQGMANGMDVVYFNGSTLVDGNMVGIGTPPSLDTNDWTTTSNTVSGTTRTVVATRAFAGGNNDYTFVYSDTSIDFAYAKSSAAGYAMNGHAGNRGYQLNKPFACVQPAAPTAAVQTFCNGATVASLTALGGSGAEINWYSSATGGAELATTAVLATGTYYVSQTIGACESPRSSVSVTVTTTPQPTVTPGQSFCTGATVANLSATGGQGSQLKWYTTASGGTELALTATLTTGTYYVSQTINGCESLRNNVNATVISLQQPAAVASQNFCAGSTVINLTATAQAGATISWYGQATNGTALATTTPLTAGTYYAGQVQGDCTSARTAVTVTITEVATPAATAQAVCQGTTVSSLAAQGTGIRWYSTQGGAALTGSTIVVTDTYYVTQTNGTCESTAVPVSVTVNQIPDAPAGNANQTFTVGETISSLDITAIAGATVTYYTLNGTVYTPIDAATALVDSVTYYVTQQTNSCESDYLAVTAHSALGIEVFSANGFLMFPNPAGDVVTISGKTALKSIAVINLLGQEVLIKTASGNEVNVNLSQLAKGTYIVKVTAENGSMGSSKLIKQ